MTLKTDVSNAVLDYLSERQADFPGVEIQQVWLRFYPLHDIAAQLFGTIGPINQQEIGQHHFRGVARDGIVGQSGLEYYYDHYLRGVDGADRVQVDSLGRPRGDSRASRQSPGTW